MFKTKKARTASRPARSESNGSASAPVLYTSNEVSRISGVSLRQLQWWDEKNVVSPRHDGHRRVYSQVEVVEVTVIAELRRKGFSLQKIRRVVRFLQKEMGKRLADALSSQSEIHMLTDGKSIYLEDSQDRIIDILKGAKQPMFLVSVTDQVRRLEAPPRKQPARSETAARRAKAI